MSRRTSIAAAVLAIATIALIWMVSVPRPPNPAPTTSTPHAVGPGIRADRLAKQGQLQERLRTGSRSLDSLAEAALGRTHDSLIARSIQEARALRDHTQYSIGLLGAAADTADPQAWEVARARAIRQMDSLEILLDLLRKPVIREPVESSGKGSAGKGNG